MKFLSTWSIRPGCVETAVQRFLAGQAGSIPGLTVLGRWHKADGSGGFTLTETDNPSFVYEYVAKWIDVLEVHSSVVLEDAEAGPILAKTFQK
ncbi:MAG TPA: DUF3303 family protein [Acidobacteriaceae bacterium]|nr:DUF3303 family protein [Acidobacteriaceae bacterium]